MRRVGKITLRNKIHKCLNNWKSLDCYAIKGDRFFVRRFQDKVTKGFHLLVFGCSNTGKAFLIYPSPKRGRIPISICLMMEAYESRNAIVGVADNIGDAYDIVDDGKDYKRKKRTFRYRRELEQWRKKRSQNGKTEDE